MKTFFRYAAIGVGVLLIGVAGLLAYVKFGMVAVNIGPAPKLNVKATQGQIDRGRYLVNHVSICLDCHSSRDWTKFSGPPIPGTLGMGGYRFGREAGAPGNIYSRNITPTGLGNWTDGEIFRAITEGVSKEGRALFPIMPHPHYGKMDRNDIEAIIAYLRTLKPIENKVPDTELDFPLNFIVNTIPQKANFQQRPDTTNPAALGAYLVNAAACVHCHTQSKDGKPVPGMNLAGGVTMKLPFGTLQSANLTPDPETGLGLWTKEAFIARFKAHDPGRGNLPHTVKPGERQVIMPWSMYAGMSETDLGAIYAYLRTLKPVKNRTVAFVPPTPARPEQARK